MELQKLKTTYCEIKEAEALVGGKSLDVAYIVVGDGNGEIPIITKDMKSLVNQRLKLNVTVDDSQKPKYKFIANIPENAEEFAIRELGIIDTDGKLLYVAQMDGTSTNLLSNGISKQLRLQMIFTPADGVNVVVIDPSVTNASVDYCDNNFQKLSEKAQANGYAPLDENAKVPFEHLPNIDISPAVEFRNYIKSCAVDSNGMAEVIKNVSNGEISEQVAISLADSNNSSNISGTGFTSSNGGYDGLNSTVTRSYTLNNSVSAVQSVAVTLGQYAAHRAGSGVWVDAVFSDGTTQRVGTQTGGGDTNVTKTYSIAVEGLKTLTGFNVTANHSAWSNGYCASSVSASNFTCTHLKTVSSAITLNATEETPIQYVPSDGVTRSITQALGKDFSSGYADGTYYLFASENAITTTTTYSKGRVAPVSPANGNYWLDTSSTPTKLKKCIVTSVTNGESDDAVTTTTAEWQETNDIYVGSVTVANNVITGVTQPITKGADCPATVVETYLNGSSGYRIWSDGWCEQWGNTNSERGKQTMTLLKTYKKITNAMATSWSDCNYAIVSTPSLSTIAVETRGFDHTVQPCTAFWYIRGYIK